MDNRERRVPSSDTKVSSRPRVSSSDLLQGRREIVILHAGSEYLLRITKSDKLILTK